MKKTLCFVVAFAALSTTLADAAPLTVEQILDQYNGVTEGNFDSSQEVEGRVYVNGNLTGNNINVGFVPLPQGTDVNVWVNGQTSVGRINAQSGKLLLNSDHVNTGIERSGNGTLEVLVKGSYSGLDNFRVVKANQGDLSSRAPQIDFSELKKYSTYLSTLSGASYDGSSPMRVINNATQSQGSNWNASKVSVYHTTLSQLQSGAFTSNLRAGSGETIIVNVAGRTGAFGLNAGVSNYGVGQQIVWNFYEAIDVSVNTKVIGSILAPNATLTNFSGSTEGSVIGKNIRLNNGELHLQSFLGDLPDMVVNTSRPAPGGATPVPEVGAEGAMTAFLLALGTMAVSTGRRRRATV